MRWPFMLKKTRDAEIDILAGLMQEALDNEYARATADGRAKVHDWAREATWNVFHGGQAQAAFQQAESIFAPSKTDIKEVLSV